jgi:hypothetical protein
VETNSHLALKNRNFINPKGSKNPENVNPAGMLQNRIVAVAEATAAAAVAVVMAAEDPNAKCTLQLAQAAVSKPKFRSNPMVPSLYIAVSAINPPTRKDTAWQKIIRKKKKPSATRKTPESIARKHLLDVVVQAAEDLQLVAELRLRLLRLLKHPISTEPFSSLSQCISTYPGTRMI